LAHVESRGGVAKPLLWPGAGWSPATNKRKFPLFPDKEMEEKRKMDSGLRRNDGREAGRLTFSREMCILKKPEGCVNTPQGNRPSLYSCEKIGPLQATIL
jgi:hypothetical protein